MTTDDPIAAAIAAGQRAISALPLTTPAEEAAVIRAFLIEWLTTSPDKDVIGFYRIMNAWTIRSAALLGPPPSTDVAQTA